MSPLKEREESIPKCVSKTGCRVAAAAIETSGTTKQARPSERTNGIGTNNKVANPKATVNPEITAVLPAVFIVASSRSAVRSRFCLYR